MLYHNRMPPLPSLDHLRAFEAAARHLSFKKAADELSVTPAAIGQRIRALESHLKIALFTRLTRKVILTDSGEELMSAVSAGLSIIHQGLSRIQSRQHINTLTISTTNSFAALCLLPLLPEFSSLHPEYEVRILTSDAKVNFSRDNIDLAIRFGKGNYPNSHLVQLTKGNYVPVCAPVLLGGKKIQTPKELSAYVLIGTDWQVERSTMPTWEKWFKMCEVEFPISLRRLSVSIEAHAISAAVNGQGIALAHQDFVKGDLYSGRLIQVLNDTYSFKSEFNHYLVWPDYIQSDVVEKFRKWAETAFSERG